MLGCDESILTLGVGGEALEEEANCELEAESEQDAERGRTISDQQEGT